MVECRLCPRLVEYREEVGRVKRKAYRDWEYWAKPVPSLGDPEARLLVIGLAPGAHGGNRTGRIFTGDDSGDFLFRALHKAGFANQPHSHDIHDGLALHDIYITAVCHCAPPDNKPSTEEIATCLRFLVRELRILKRVQGIVLLGRIALDGLLRAYRMMGIAYPRVEFTHCGFQQPVENLPWLITSYHPSRQNTNTGRLTEAMFDEVWITAKGLLK
jgi:uracil-DNA glycosylase family 4